MSFYWFNQAVVSHYLKAKFKDASINDHYFGNDSYQKLHQLNRCFSSKPYGLQHDITNHVPHHFNIKTKTIYQYHNETRTFGDICIDTAKNIIRMTDRPIAVCWSGGIDSTAVLVALMQVIPLDRLTVVQNHASISEFPSFYEKKIKDRVKTISPLFLSQNYKDFFSVTGDGGDTVWGVIDDSFWKDYRDLVNLPWQDIIDRDLMSDMTFVEEFCSWSGVDIKSWLDLRIWFYLCCKWQDKCMRPYWLRHHITDKDTVAFFDIDSSFQHWTMNNLDKIIGKNWEDYKVPAKEFIYQYHNDEDYFRYKSKVGSVYLEPELRSNYSQCMRLAVADDFLDRKLSCWPFIDYAELENFNKKYHLIPQVLED